VLVGKIEQVARRRAAAITDAEEAESARIAATVEVDRMVVAVERPVWLNVASLLKSLRWRRS